MSVITYLRIEDLEYPRNQLIRAAMREAGHSVRIVNRVKDGPKLLRMLKDFRNGMAAGHGSDVIVVPEFSLPFVPAAWLISRLRGATLVVDGFVGKYETVVEDWERASPRSLTALSCRMQDGIALGLSDLFLIDTDMRADAARKRSKGRKRVFTLPVGSPEWIRPEPPQKHDGGLTVLYSGGMLPLHGVPFFLEGLAQTKDTTTTLTMIAAAPEERLQELREEIERLGITDRCTLVEPTSHRGLIDIVKDHDVILGVFGDSPKARSVLANKVWQGLAAGRTVVTRSTPALSELATAGNLLIAVDTPAELAAQLDELAARRSDLPNDPGIADRLEEYVRTRFAEFLAALTPNSTKGSTR